MTVDVTTWTAAVREAARALAGHVETTPLVRSARLSAATGGEVRLKLESLQATGSFKLRGASHALLRLPDPARRRGVVAASSGNHGLGVATAARTLGVPATVFVPTSTSLQRRQRIAAAGAEVTVFGDDCVQTEDRARAVATATGRTYVSPYNDADVVAGQGTVALELLREWPQVEVVYVALGGGGLIGGMAAFARGQRPDVEFVACSPAASPAMEECVRAGRIVDVPCLPTWSHSTAGGVEPGAITFELCRQLAHRYLRVDEASIAAQIVATLREDRLLVEGAAAVAIAGLLRDEALRGRRAAVVVCGGNLETDELAALLATS